MKLWHFVVGIMVLAVIMAIARDEVGRVALIMFFTSLGVVIIGTSSIMVLFRTIGAFGAARSWMAHAEATAATACIVVLGGGSMVAVMWLGAFLLSHIVR